MSWPRSMRQRLTLLMGMLTLLTLGGVTLGVYVLLQRQLRATVDRQLHERTHLISQAIARDDPTTPDSPSLLLPPPLVEFATPGLYVLLLDANGQVRSASSDLPPGYLPLDPAAIQAAGQGHPALATVTIGNDTQLRMLMTVVARPGVAPELLVVAESLEPLQRILRQTLVVLVVCGVLGIAAAVGGTILVTRQTFAPILQVTETAHEVAETHDYQRRISVPPQDDEVGQLATTINRLIATVDATLAQQQQLLADTSHELRSPLTAILANLALLQRDLAPEERVLSVTEATAEAQRMRRLITDLLLLSQPATPEVVDRRPVALETILTPLVLSLSRQWPTYALTYVMSPEAWVVGDAERLAQVLRNVLENAIYHTPPGTTIHVQLDQAAADVVVTVADSGPGIAAEHLPKIWHRLYRVDKARSRRHGGTGLGLAIVQYLMAAHGGEVSVDSTVGQGTTVMLRFPRQQRARAGEQPAACVCNVATIRQPAADVQRNDPE